MPCSMTRFYRVNKILIGGAFRLYFRLGVSGQEGIPEEGPCILASNHCSYLDPIAVGTASPRPIHPLAKEELWRVPLLSWWLKRIGVIPIRRGQGDAGSLRAALEALGHGETILVFPEGTRSRDGNIGPLKSGVGFLACRSRATIIPTYISGTFHALPRTGIFPRPVKISVHFGSPVGLDLIREGPRERETYEEITRRLEEALHALEKKANQSKGTVIQGPYNGGGCKAV